MNDGDWAEYARLQQHADSTTLNDKYWAVDEALDAVLAEIEAGEPVSARQTENLITNRAAKHCRRRADLDNHSTVLTFSTGVKDENGLHARCRLLECSAQCSPREWDALASIGLGHTYRAVAHRHSVPEATAKTWVRRARLRLAAQSLGRSFLLQPRRRESQAAPPFPH